MGGTVSNERKFNKCSSNRVHHSSYRASNPIKGIKETLHNRETEVFIAGLMLIIASFGLYIKTKM